MGGKRKLERIVVDPAEETSMTPQAFANIEAAFRSVAAIAPDYAFALRKDRDVAIDTQTAWEEVKAGTVFGMNAAKVVKDMADIHGMPVEWVVQELVRGDRAVRNDAAPQV